MEPFLNILHLEDNALDAELIQEILEKDGRECKILRVDTRKDYVNAIEHNAYNLILVDYTLPSFDGITALEIAREKCPEIPFIFVTGTLGEEIAIETLKKGATDYVLKQNLSRLVPAVLRALQESAERAERKRAEEAVLEAKRDWENIFQAIGSPTVILDTEHNVMAANHATLRALGADSEEQLKGKKCYELFHNATEPPKGCPFLKLQTSLQFTTVEMEVEALNGTYLVSCTPVFDEKGDLLKVIHIATDITARKQTEDSLKKSEKKYKTLIEHLPQKIFLKDKNSVYMSCNENFARDLGINPDEIAGRTDYEFFPRDLADKYREDDRNVLTSGQTGEIEEKYLLHGEEFWVYTVKTPVTDEQGNVIGVLGVFRDITERKKMEKEKAQRIQDLEDFYQMAVGRELRIKELKEQIEELQERLVKYEKVDNEL